MDAILPVWKPVGWTSFQVVKKIKKYVKPSKVGHAGTLDPFAEGILVICIGKMTSRVESLIELKKEYIGTCKLGSVTDTLDPTGVIQKQKPIPELNAAFIENILSNFIGTIEQIPPMYSALKVNGKRLYKLARKGIVVERKLRQVQIYNIELLDFDDSSFSIRTECGRGTYIRQLVYDISVALGTVGHLTTLERTKVGDYDKNNTLKIEEIPNWLSTVA